MIKRIIAGCLLAIVLVSCIALAQQNESQNVFAFASCFGCSPDAESRADEIINTSCKPHYDAAVDHGDVLSWSWLQHFVGGNWRRLLTMGAEDHKTLMKARGAIIGEFGERRFERAFEQMNRICHTHQDTMWDILVRAR